MADNRNALGAIGGLTTGLFKGVSTGVALDQRQQELDRRNLESEFGIFDAISKLPHGPFKKASLGRFLPRLGFSQDTTDMLLKGNEEDQEYINKAFGNIIEQLPQDMGFSGFKDLVGRMTPEHILKLIDVGLQIEGMKGAQATQQAIQGALGGQEGEPEFTPEGRKIIRSPSGQMMSEVSATVEVPGGWLNIPTLFGGKKVSDEEALSRVTTPGGYVDPETGRRLPIFGSMAEAESAARKRSDDIGKMISGRGTAATAIVANLKMQRTQLNTLMSHGSPAQRDAIRNRIAHIDKEIDKLEGRGPRTFEQELELRERTGLQAANIQLETARQREQIQPLSATDQQAIQVHTQNLANVSYILKEFSDEEVEKFVGLLNRPKEEAKLIARGVTGRGGSERYAQFKAFNERVRGAAFGEGGKQLTPFEAGVVFGFTPTGREAGGSVEYKAKARNLIVFSRAARDLRLKLAREGKGTIDTDKYDSELQKVYEGLSKKDNPLGAY